MSDTRVPAKWLAVELTQDEADAVRAALANYANRMSQAYGMHRHLDYATQVELCEAVIAKLNRAEGRSDEQHPRT